MTNWGNRIFVYTYKDFTVEIYKDVDDLWKCSVVSGEFNTRDEVEAAVRSYVDSWR